MGKWFLDFSFWIQSYRTAQTAHCAVHNVHCIHMSVCYWEPRLKLRKKMALLWTIGVLVGWSEALNLILRRLLISPSVVQLAALVCIVLQYAAKHIDQYPTFVH